MPFFPSYVEACGSSDMEKREQLRGVSHKKPLEIAD
jgi:hypothetical protein